MEKVNLKNKLNTFSEAYVPKVVGELNGQYVKVVKFNGEYVWHHHENEDEMFLVLKGQIDIEFEDHTETLKEGEFLIVEKGVKHRPIAREEAHVLLFETNTTRNTGNVDHKYTIEADDLEKI